MSTTAKPGVLAVMDAFADEYAAHIPQFHAQNRKRMKAEVARLREARATVERMADAAKFVLDKEWEYGEDQPACARLNDALAAFRGEA